MDKLKSWITNHQTLALVLVLGILGVLGWLGVQKIVAQPQGPLQEVDLPFDAEGPYALLYPRRDGNALILNLQRTSSYDSISYELSYASASDETVVAGNKVALEEGSLEGGVIDRGVKGTINTQERKGEYEQEILFGTCSKNVCKYDKGVENGTLTLYIKKGNKVYRMVTLWHLQKPDIALGVLTSGDTHLVYQTEGDRQALANIGFTIISDLTGVPKLPLGKLVVGKVYALNPLVTKEVGSGLVSLNLAENPPAGAQLYRYNRSKGEWQRLETKIEGSKLSAQTKGAGIFAVLTSSK